MPLINPEEHLTTQGEILKYLCGLQEVMLDENSQFTKLVRSLSSHIKVDPQLDLLIEFDDVVGKISESLCFMTPSSHNIA